MTYLGDGVYAEYDGYQLKLCANSATNPTDTIYLDAHTWLALELFVKTLHRDAENAANQATET